MAGTVTGTGLYNNVVTAYAENVRYDSTSAFTMVATAAEHYHFVNWTSADTVFSTEATTTINSLDTFGLAALQFTANFELDSHLVKALAENGSFTFDGVAADSVYVTYGDSVVVAPVAASHYHFNGWADEYADTVRMVNVFGDVTVEALFGIDTQYVKAVVNDAQFGIVSFAEGYSSLEGNDTAWYTYGATAKMAATPATGYHVQSWSNVAGSNDTIEFPVYANYTVTVNFDTNVYNVTYVAENGSIEGPATIKHFTSDSLFAVADYGYHFASWQGVESESDTAILSGVVNDTTITATFEKNSYTVTAAANYDSLGTVSEPATALYLDSVVLYATAIEGYHVAGWSNGMTGDTIKVRVEADSTITVNFAINVYNVTASAAIAERGTVTGAHETEHGAVDTLVAVANYGYVFAGWSNGVTTDTMYLTVVSDTNVVASFDKASFTVTALVNDSTMGTATVNNTTALYLDTVVFTAVANEGFHFVSWSNGATNDTISVVIAGDTTLTATFEADPVTTATITLVSADPTMGTVSNNSGEYELGTSFTAVATPNSGYLFVAWMNGDDTASTQASYTFEVTEDVTLTAVFEAAPVHYTVTIVIEGQGTVTGDGQYLAGQIATLTATPAEGYRFVEWRNGTQVLSTDNPFSYTVNANVTITAVFAQDGIDDVDMSDVTIYSTDSKIVVRGAENQSVYVFDVNGRVITSEVSAAETCEFRMASTGVYLVKVGNAPAKRVLVVR